MLERLGLVIHWLGFITGSILCLLPVIAEADISTTFSVVTFSFVIFFLCPWAIRYILAGKIHFFPWMKNNSFRD